MGAWLLGLGVVDRENITGIDIAHCRVFAFHGTRLHFTPLFLATSPRYVRLDMEQPNKRINPYKSTLFSYPFSGAVILTIE